MWNRRPAQRTALLMVVTVLVATATTGALLSAAGREPTGLQLVLAPHPDDEMLAWSAIEDDPSTYTVVVALTRGEATSRCDDVERFTQQAAGEVLPDPLPEPGDTAACGRARIAAWSSFLRGAAGHTAEIRTGSAVDTISTDERWGGDADFAVGDNAAHVALSLPDGGLDQAGVVEAVQALLASRGDILPDLPLRRIVSAGYWNDSDQSGTNTKESGGCTTSEDCPGTPMAFEYEHPDHRSLSLAMPALAALTEADSWVNVPPGEVADLRHALGSDTGRVQTMTLSPDDYEALMGLGRDGEQGPQRLGLHQQFYGWLAFPGEWWAIGEVTDTDVLFARQQTYLVIDGDGR